MKKFFCLTITILLVSCFLMNGNLYVYAAENESIVLPIIMYHAIFPSNISRLPFSIHISDLQRDLNYIQAEGYTTVFAKELVDYVENGTPLPKKPIMLTFDDGYYSMKSLVLPELQTRNMKAVCAVVGKFAETYADHNDKYGYLDYGDIQELEESGNIEIANHTYDMHWHKARHGSRKKWKEGEVAYKNAFMSDVKALQDKLAEFNIKPTTFVYPYGFFEEHSDEYLKELGFKVSFSCMEKKNYITRDPSCLWVMCRMNRDKNNAQQLLNKFNNMK